MHNIKVALLGLADEGQHYLSAIVNDHIYDLMAVSDRDVNLLRSICEATSIRGFEDYRSLIVELSREGLEALFIALEPHESYEFVLMAAQAGVAVFHKPPFARHVREAQNLVDSFRANKQPLVIARTWPYVCAGTPPDDLDAEIGQVQLATAEVASTANSTGWRGDGMRSGGGVLLNGAYAELDMLISVMGLPEEVFAQCSRYGQMTDVHNYDTEDMVALALRFSTHRSAVLTAHRNAQTNCSHISWIGQNGVCETSTEAFMIEAQNAEAKGVRKSNAMNNGITAAVHDFGVALVNRAKHLSTGEDHLATLAVLETAYLSARTGAMESVGRFLSVE